MVFKRCIALINVIALLTLLLASCSKSMESRIEKADKRLEKKPYVMEIDVEFSSDDNLMSMIFEQLGRNETTIFVKDERIKAVNSQYINYGEGEDGFITTYTIIDGILYHEITHESGGISRTNKNKGEFTNDEIRDLIARLCLFGDIGTDKYETVNEYTDDGSYFIVCTDATLDAKIALERVLVRIVDVQDLLSTVKVDQIKYIIEIEDGKYESMKLECVYTVTISDTTASVRMEAEIEFDYDERFSIDIPSDVLEYNDAKMSEIIN